MPHWILPDLQFYHEGTSHYQKFQADLVQSPKLENPTSLLGATGQAGSMAPDEIAGLKDESLLTTHFTISFAEGAYR